MISQPTTNKLVPEWFKLLRFYSQPEIHKVNDSGKPVTSSLSLHTIGRQNFADIHLKPNLGNCNLT